jgi:hypothetical protein
VTFLARHCLLAWAKVVYYSSETLAIRDKESRE